MKQLCNTRVFLLIINVFLLPKSSHGRTIVKRSPQLSLTVIDEPDSTPRGHPPSPEDIEERRQALVKALVPGGGSAAGMQLQTLTDLGLDLVGGSVANAGELFAPLFNATKKARESFPRAGDVLNRVVDSAREYRKNAGGALRESASSKVNNGIRIFTTATARGTEVLGGVFKLVRSLLDNLTLAIQNLAGTLSRGLARFAETKTNFLSTNFRRLRALLQNRMLFQPARDAAELGGNLVRGLAQDFTSLQPAVSEGVKTKITVGTRLIPRIRLTSILSPLGDPEPCSDDGDIAAEGESQGGYGKKRDSEKVSSGENSSISLEDIPKDVLDLLASSNSEKKTKPDGGSSEDGTSTTPKILQVDTTTIKPTTTTTTISTSKPSTTTIPSTTTTAKTTSTTSSNTTPKSSNGNEKKSASIEDLFGISSNST